MEAALLSNLGIAIGGSNKNQRGYIRRRRKKGTPAETGAEFLHITSGYKTQPDKC
jgi:hypothetical protein